MKKIKSIILLSLAVILISALSIKSYGTFSGDIKTIKGTITSVDHPIAKLKAEDGKEYTVYMGPYWYWEENNYSLSIDKAAEIKGEIQGNEIYPFNISQDEKNIILTDENGSPNWSNSDCPYKGWGRGNCKWYK